MAHVLCPHLSWPCTPLSCGDPSVGAVWSPMWCSGIHTATFSVRFVTFWGVSGPCSGILEAKRVCPHLPIPALRSTQWLLFAFGVGE